MEIFHMPYKIKPAQRLSKEVEEGNHEYKFKLTNLTEDQMNHRISQLHWRLNEGNNEAFYHIGVEDNGNSLGLSETEMNESLKTLQIIADKAGCDMCVRHLFAAEKGLTAEVVMTRRERLTVDSCHLTVTVAGDLDAGKSTIIGVLSSGQFDNGKGLARTRVFTHNHEIETGRTSSISHTLLHFDKEGNILNAEGNLGGKSKRVRALSDLELADETTRTVTLIDLAGHPKYLKTTVHGMLGRKPDYCIVCISCIAGIQSMTYEHIGIGISLNVPLIFVFTKVDQLYPNRPTAATAASYYSAAKEHTKIKELINNLTNFFEASSYKGPFKYEFQFIDSNRELIDFLAPNNRVSQTNLVEGNIPKIIIPVLLVSNVTGDGLLMLKSLLYQLPDLSKANGKLEVEQSTDNDNCTEVYLKKGNYIRIFGSISISGNDDDGEEDEEDEDEFEEENRRESEQSRNSDDNHHSALLKQLEIIEKEICGIKSSFDLDDNNDTEDIEEIQCDQKIIDNSIFQNHFDEIQQYKKSLIELSSFIDLVPEKKENNNNTNKKLFRIQSKILIGKVISGKLQVMDELFFGPTLDGNFIPVMIASIRLNNVPVRYATAGQTATFRLIRIMKRSYDNFHPLIIRKTEKLISDSRTSSPITTTSMNNHFMKPRSAAAGLILMSSQLEPTATYEFEAEILIMNHPSKIRVNYEPVIHVGSVRQTGKIMEIHKIMETTTNRIDQEIGEEEKDESSVSPSTSSTPMREKSFEIPQDSPSNGNQQNDEVGNGDKAIIRFKFLYNPEFIMIGETIIIREDRTKGIGKITRLIR